MTAFDRNICLEEDHEFCLGGPLQESALITDSMKLTYVSRRQYHAPVCIKSIRLKWVQYEVQIEVDGPARKVCCKIRAKVKKRKYKDCLLYTSPSLKKKKNNGTHLYIIFANMLRPYAVFR